MRLLEEQQANNDLRLKQQRLQADQKEEELRKQFLSEKAKKNMMGVHNHVPIDEEDSYDEESDQEVIP